MIRDEVNQIFSARAWRPRLPQIAFATSLFLATVSLTLIVGGKWWREVFVTRDTLRYEGNRRLHFSRQWVLADGCVQYSQAHTDADAAEFKKYNPRADQRARPRLLQPPGTMYGRDGLGARKALWFGYDEGRFTWRTTTRHGYAVRVPLWPVFAVFSAAPLLRLARWCRARRSALRGGCAGCGYDLRASRERCPECGAGTGATGDAVAVT